jgi:hypothetical protein
MYCNHSSIRGKAKMNIEIGNEITLAQAKELAVKSGIIFYGANTCWWTTEREHLYKHPQCGLPCDPRSGMLFETENVVEFFDAAEKTVEHYGKHGLRAFLLAYHGGVVTKDKGFPTCFDKWEEYNKLLDGEMVRPSLNAPTHNDQRRDR